QATGGIATWAWERLTNRTDAWGGYYPEYKIVKRTTRPAKARRGSEQLTVSHLVRHFLGRSVNDLVGLHSTSPDNTSRWGALDIDQHAPDDAPPEQVERVQAANWAAALAWYADLCGLGLRPLLMDSTGRGGFHLWVLFRWPQPTPEVYRFLQLLVVDYAEHELAAPPETFPKQRNLTGIKYGNWLRLPGRHPTRPHWSRVWGGERW